MSRTIQHHGETLVEMNHDESYATPSRVSGRRARRVSAHERSEPLDGTVARLPHRYQRLVKEVLDRLPSGWMGCDPSTGGLNVAWRFDLSCDVHLTARGRIAVASATADQFDTTHCWTITLFLRVLDHLSDSAVHWVIAHEFAYLVGGVTSGTARGRDVPGSGITSALNRSDAVRARAARQRDAMNCALGWGFGREKKAYDREVRTL
jgi:hypothetical protein